MDSEVVPSTQLLRPKFSDFQVLGLDHRSGLGEFVWRNRAGTKTYRFNLDTPGDRQSAGLPLPKSHQGRGQNDGQNLYECLIESPAKQFAAVDNLSTEPKAVPRSASKRHLAVSFGELSQDLLANQLKKAGQ